MSPRRLGLPRPDRAVRALLSQETARTNAFEASAVLQRGRHERDEVDAYLRVMHPPLAARTG